MTTYYVDIPTENCITQTDGAFKNVAEFTTPQEAVKFCQEHFAADESGCVSLISPAISTRRQQILTYAALVYARANIDDFNNAFAADKGIEVEGEWMESATEEDFMPSKPESNSECAWRQYDQAKCPDCGEGISHSAVRGEACQNCGHVWAWGQNPFSFPVQGRNMNKFPLGKLVATPGALEALADAGQTPDFFLDKHIQGDWGEVCDSDKRLNDEALVNGDRILSAYRTLKNVRIWIITEADRSSTTILKPEEY